MWQVFVGTFFGSFAYLDVYKKICHTEINSMQKVFEFRQNVKGLVHMFSEALSVMTKNTERYMVEQLQKKVELQEEALEQNKAALEQKDRRILELERLLANANSNHKHPE